MLRSTSSPSSPLTSATKKITQSLSSLPPTQLDTQTCSLLGPFSILIQALMAMIILTSLLYKRHREKPKRKYHIWAADVSKQGIGQAFVHMLNIFISDSLASLPSRGNPCALYFMNIFIDTTIGVFVLFLALNSITTLISKILRKSPASLGLSSGHYPRPFLMSWGKQISIYFVGLLILKLFVIGLFWLGGEALVKFGDSIIEAISNDPKIQILMVVMVGPTVLNVLQFLLIDSFIKHKPNFTPEQGESDDDRRFLNDDSDLDSDEPDLEDDDDHDNRRNSTGLPNHGDEDRTVRKKKDFQNRYSTRHQRARLSNATNLHGSLSAVAANIHDPHSYPPRIPQPETRERTNDLAYTLQTRRRIQTSLKTIHIPPRFSASISNQTHDSHHPTSPTFARSPDNQENSTLIRSPHNTHKHMDGLDRSINPVRHSMVQIIGHANHCTSPTQLKTGFSPLHPDPSLYSTHYHHHHIESPNRAVY